MKKLTYKDPAIIVRLETDEYGDLSVVKDQADIKTLFFIGMTSNQSDYVNNLGTDAHTYLDIENDYIKRNLWRLEGMFVVFDRYGEKVWYKIERIKIGRTALTDNVDNCCHAFLSLSASLVDLDDNPPYPPYPEESS